MSQVSRCLPINSDHIWCDVSSCLATYFYITRCAIAHLPLLVRSAFRFASLSSLRMAFLGMSCLLFHLSLVREVFRGLKHRMNTGFSKG